MNRGRQRDLAVVVEIPTGRVVSVVRETFPELVEIFTEKGIGTMVVETEPISVAVP